MTRETLQTLQQQTITPDTAEAPDFVTGQPADHLPPFSYVTVGSRRSSRGAGW